MITVDARCGCLDCRARTENIYRMIGACSNCGQKRADYTAMTRAVAKAWKREQKEIILTLQKVLRQQKTEQDRADAAEARLATLREALDNLHKRGCHIAEEHLEAEDDPNDGPCIRKFNDYLDAAEAALAADARRDK